MTLPVIRAGEGPRLVLVHGSATDHATWSIQLVSPLRQRFELVTYDRRPVATIGDAASDLAEVVGDVPAIVIGSSFGAVVGLELARSRRAPCAGLVLIEPPMPATDDPPDVFAAAQASFGAAPTSPPLGGFLERFDRVLAESGGPAAGEYFLHAVLGAQAFAKIPRAFLERSKAKWAEIRADCVALLAYAPRYAELRALDLPVLLLGGEHSAPYFALTLDALAAALPRARRVTVPHAGHMLHAEAPNRFTQLITSFATDIGFS
ncbi:MAG TPA: alpha/beta hydrolase [Kofleriaceae bacterium]|nr:alpha/beta hydrolase [Kofleriaceae bacterium]